MTALAGLLADHPLSPPDGAKDERGGVVIAGAPAACPGAVLLAAEAALRSGAGRVQLAVHPAVATHVAVAVPEAFVLEWDPNAAPSDDLAERLERADASLIGPGYSDGIGEAARSLADLVHGPVVLDAGALAAAGELADRHLVLAPNTAEAEGLAGREGTEAELALVLGEARRTAVAVRGATTAITDGEGSTWRCEPRAAGLGTPGSGDVLVGVLVALLARGLPDHAALGWAVAVHDRAGEIVERRRPVGYLARELVEHLPQAFSELTGG